MTCIATGIFLSYFRMREPVFKKVMTKYIYQFFGELSDEDDGSKSTMDSTLLSFLMSSLNIELVHIILTTVSKNTVGTPKSVSNFKVYQDYDHYGHRTGHPDWLKKLLGSYNIDNASTWPIATRLNP